MKNLITCTQFIRGIKTGLIQNGYIIVAKKVTSNHEENLKITQSHPECPGVCIENAGDDTFHPKEGKNDIFYHKRELYNIKKVLDKTGNVISFS